MGGAVWGGEGSGGIGGHLRIHLSLATQSEGAEVGKKLWLFRGRWLLDFLWGNYAFIFIPSPAILSLDA